MLPILGGSAALARSDLVPCRCGETRFLVVEARGVVSVQCSRCRPLPRGRRPAGMIDVKEGTS